MDCYLWIINHSPYFYNQLDVNQGLEGRIWQVKWNLNIGAGA